MVKDVRSQFRYVYPSETKGSEQCHSDMLQFLKVEDQIGVVYSDNVPELESAVKQLGVRRNTSRACVNENKAVIERDIRTILEGARSNLTQANLPDHVWPLAAQHHAMALNSSKRYVERIPWEDRFGEPFDGLIVHFGAKVIYWNKGIFLGYRFQPGFIWKKDCFVTPLKGGREAIQDANFKILRTKGMERPDGEIVFSVQNDEIQDPPPPNLVDQTRFSKAEDKLPGDLDDDEHQDLFELFGIGEGETSLPRGEATEGKGGDKKASDHRELSKNHQAPKALPKPNLCLYMIRLSCLAVNLVLQALTGMVSDLFVTNEDPKGLLTLPLSFGACTPLNNAKKT